MSYQMMLIAVLLGTALYPFFSNHLPNQRQNASAVIGVLFFGVFVLGAGEYESLLHGQPLHAGIEVLSFLFFGAAFLHRTRGKFRLHTMSYIPYFLGVGAACADPLVAGLGLQIGVVALQGVCLVVMIKAYGNRIQTVTKVKAYYFAVLYCIVDLAMHASYDAANNPTTVALSFTQALYWLLLASAVAHMFFQDFSRSTLRKQLEGLTKVDNQVMQLAYRGKRVLKDFRHDLRQPLSTMGILASVGKAISKDPEVTARYQHIQTAQRALKSMLEDFFEQLTQAIRYPSQSQLTPLKPTRIDDILSPLVEEYRLLADGKGLQIRYVPSDLVVQTHRETLTKILRNGLDNAIKYTKQGGVVVGLRRKGGRVCVQISDTGTGVDTDQVAKHHKGWGHGSSMVMELSEDILATTECKNRYYGGKLVGSVFEVLLPGDAELQAYEKQRDQEPVTTLQARVLTISEESMTEVKRILPCAGFDSVEYSTAGAYRSYLQALHRGMPSVYIMYAGNCAEVEKAREEIKLLCSLLEYHPCCILVENAPEKGGHAIRFDDGLIRIPCHPKRSDKGLHVLEELFPPRDTASPSPAKPKGTGAPPTPTAPKTASLL